MMLGALSIIYFWRGFAGKGRGKSYCTVAPRFTTRGLNFGRLLADKHSRGEFHEQVSYVAVACGLGYFGLPCISGKSH